MPRRYRRKRRTQKRRTYKRRRRYSRVRRPILEGFKKRQLVKLRYVQEIALDALSNSFDYHEFRANSVNDPDLTGVGHQPMGHDEWSGIYSRYVVVGSKINVMYAPTSTTAVIPAYYGVTLYDTSGSLTGTYSTVEGILESKLTGHTTTMAGNVNSTFAPRMLSRKFSARKFFGKSNVMDDPDLGALIGSNPVNDAIFAIWAGNIGGNDPGSVNLKVQIDYIVLYHEPYLLPQS